MFIHSLFKTSKQVSNPCQGSMNHIHTMDKHAPNVTSYSKHQQSGPGLLLNFPERPDQPECQHYMKTGGCNYGTSCKYHHPKERNQAAITTIGPLGLPLRPVNLSPNLFGFFIFCVDSYLAKFFSFACLCLNSHRVSQCALFTPHMEGASLVQFASMIIQSLDTTPTLYRLFHILIHQ